MNSNKFKELEKSKYDQYASWAIWDDNNEKNPAIILENTSSLHAKYVFVGLNISKELDRKSWSNFRGGAHDRKLKYACNDTKLRGAYITDLFKFDGKDKSMIEPNSGKFKPTPIQIEKNIKKFTQEMLDIGISKNESVLIILGKKAQWYFEHEFNKHITGLYKKAVPFTHYAYFGWTDKKWVTQLWKELGIEGNFEQTHEKYKKEKK
jgi:hypothetical protein